MLFHTTEAWNLASAMYGDRKLGADPDSYVKSKFEEGYRNGWIRPHIQKSALEMFVFTDRVYLPPDLDIRTPGDQHMAWRADGVKDEILRSPDDPREMEELADYIIPQLIARGQLTNIGDFWSAVRRWKEEAAKSGDYSHSYDNPIQHAIVREFLMAQRTARFAQAGIPTFTGLDLGALTSGKSAPPQTDGNDTLSVIRIYFNKQILVPSPDTFAQALDLRENPRIIEWRKKVQLWASKLSSGQISAARIIEEISDANDYLLGAQFGTRLLPEWTAAITIPAATYELSLAQHEVAHAIGFTLLGIELIKTLSKVAQRATQSPDPLQYKWLLLKSDS